MKKKILMPSNFVTGVHRLLCSLDYLELDDFTKSLCRTLESQINAKFDAMDRHDSFTKYKIASPDSDERELYRREYLDKAGIHRDWISGREMSDEDISLLGGH